jgi:hypothetical protein
MRLVACAVLAALAAGESRSVSPFSFCPECWGFRTEEWSIDEEGRCGRCRKPFVALEATIERWWWCGLHGGWHSRPCFEDPHKRCCRECASFALERLGPGDLVRAARYCPGCRRFEEAERKGRCLLCDRPQIWADAVARTWYWCGGDRAWVGSPCPQDPTDRCCVSRSGLLLLTPRFARP